MAHPIALHDDWALAEQALQLQQQASPSADTTRANQEVVKSIALRGRVDHLIWLDARGLLNQWPSDTLVQVATQYGLELRASRRRQMEQMMLWLAANHPEALAKTGGDPQLFETFRYYIDWRYLSAHDILYIAQDHPNGMRVGWSLASELVKRRDFDTMRILADNQCFYWPNACVTDAAARGVLEMLQFIFTYRPRLGTDQAMVRAARGGHFSVATALHQRGNENSTCLAMDLAATRGHLEIVQFLFENRTEGCTGKALVGAARRGHVDIVAFLLEHLQDQPIQCTHEPFLPGAWAANAERRVQLRDVCGDALKVAAMEKGSVEMVTLIHEAFHPQCCDGSCSRKSVEAVVASAARFGRLDVLQYLVSYCDLARLSIDSTAFAAAAAHANETTALVVLEFLRLSCETVISSLDFSQALCRAARRGHQQIVELLLSYNNASCSPRAISHAIRSGNLQLVKLLTSRFPSEIPRSALRTAAQCHNVTMSQYLHDHHHSATCHSNVANQVMTVRGRGGGGGGGRGGGQVVWELLLYLRSQCKSHQQINAESVLAAMKETRFLQMLRASDVCGFLVLLNADDPSVQRKLATLSRTESLHLFVCLQRGFPQLFESSSGNDMDAPWVHQLQWLLERVRNGQVAAHAISQARRPRS